MPQRYYEYAPVFIGACGAIIGFVAYEVEHYVSNYANDPQIFWIVFTLFLMAVGSFVGVLMKRLHDLSCTDPLTRLWNRRYFSKRLKQEMERMKRTKAPLSLAMVDLDEFKQVNDEHGHMKGDKVLLEIVGVFLQAVRASDVVARWGGDEFAIILPDADLEDASNVAERIRAAIEQEFILYGVTASIGVIAVNPAQDVNQLLIEADRVLYKAKANKNLVLNLT